MLIHPTLDKLRGLKLNGMLKELQEQQTQKEINSLSFEERLGLLVERESLERENRALGQRIKAAKFKIKEASVEDINYKKDRNIDRSLILSLSSCKWIKEANNIIMTGPTGSGKSYLACALAKKACIQGYKSKYLRASNFFTELSISKGDGRYLKLMNSLSRIQLLIIDDFAMSPIGEAEQSDLLEVLDERYEKSSTIITSQTPYQNWHEYIPNANFADAIMDRIVHNSYKFGFKGTESLRKEKSVKNEN